MEGPYCGLPCRKTAVTPQDLYRDYTYGEGEYYLPLLLAPTNGGGKVKHG